MRLRGATSVAAATTTIRQRRTPFFSVRQCLRRRVEGHTGTGVKSGGGVGGRVVAQWWCLVTSSGAAVGDCARRMSGSVDRRTDEFGGEMFNNWWSVLGTPKSTVCCSKLAAVLPRRARSITVLLMTASIVVGS